MRVPAFRSLSHAPGLRALALLAWLAMACVPAVAAARTMAMAGSASPASVHMHASMQGADCCHGHAGGAHDASQCEACAATVTGVPVPVMMALIPAPLHDADWPLADARLSAPPTVPPLRPPRA